MAEHGPTRPHDILSDL